jgi:hypothetical protein
MLLDTEDRQRKEDNEGKAFFFDRNQLEWKTKMCLSIDPQAISMEIDTYGAESAIVQAVQKAGVGNILVPLRK